jgi:dTDP-4-dehydrorhamnose reductase
MVGAAARPRDAVNRAADAPVLVTGAGGQLGSHLLALLGDRAVGVTRADLDITSGYQVAATIDEVAPGVVINAAAYTAVDAAEDDESTAEAVNVHAVRHLATAAKRNGARFVHVSTDYVFRGDASRPYEPTDPTGPRTAYGRTKLAGERAALSSGGWVVRTAWVYGGPSPNFVDTMLRLAAERATVTVVSDQVGSPTYVADLAAALVELAGSAVPPGVLHYVNAGTASWFDLAQETFRAAGLDPERVLPVSSAEFVRPAPRPAWSVLSTASWTAAGLSPPRPWQDALREYVAAAQE